MARPQPDRENKGERIRQAARALLRDVVKNGKCLDNEQAVDVQEMLHTAVGKAVRHVNRTNRQSRGGAVKGQK